MNAIKTSRLALIAIAATLPAAAVDALEITPRIDIVAGNGKPANDIPAIGIAFHRELANGWYLGFSLDHSPLFDFEDTAGLVDNLAEVGIVDADSTHTMITLVGERRYPMQAEDWSWFWNLGGGFNEVDVDDVEGPLAGGGRYDVETEVDTELVLVGNVGWINRIGERWSARYEVTMEYHAGDWKMRDRISGNTGSISDYNVYGIRVGMSYRF